jgi:hypothetical protein
MAKVAASAYFLRFAPPAPLTHRMSTSAGVIRSAKSARLGNPMSISLWAYLVSFGPSFAPASTGGWALAKSRDQTRAATLAPARIHRVRPPVISINPKAVRKSRVRTHDRRQGRPRQPSVGPNGAGDQFLARCLMGLSPADRAATMCQRSIEPVLMRQPASRRRAMY